MEVNIEDGTVLSMVMPGLDKMQRQGNEWMHTVTVETDSRVPASIYILVSPPRGCKRTIKRTRAWCLTVKGRPGKSSVTFVATPAEDGVKPDITKFVLEGHRDLVLTGRNQDYVPVKRESSHGPSQAAIKRRSQRAYATA